MTIDIHCFEVVTDDPYSDMCGRTPIGYRLDEEGDPYPVCRTHLRGPYWLTARSELRAARSALAAVREVREADKRPCRGQNSNVCVAEGCYGEACIR